MTSIESFQASMRELSFIDRIEELEQFAEDEYHRGYRQGVVDAQMRIKKILQEEGFWDE